MFVSFRRIFSKQYDFQWLPLPKNSSSEYLSLKHLEILKLSLFYHVSIYWMLSYFIVHLGDTCVTWKAPVGIIGGKNKSPVREPELQVLWDTLFLFPTLQWYIFFYLKKFAILYSSPNTPFLNIRVIISVSTAINGVSICLLISCSPSQNDTLPYLENCRKLTLRLHFFTIFAKDCAKTNPNLLGNVSM